MKPFSFLFLLFFAGSITAQTKETFDIVTYAPPKGWKKKVTENSTTYTIIDNKNNSWCQVGIVKSTISKGNIDADFDSEWQGLVVKIYKITEAPKLNDVQETGGWKIKAGAGNFIFNNSTAMALLTTASGYGYCASIVATTNNQGYLKDIEALLSSVDMLKPVAATQSNTSSNNDPNSILGTWAASASNNSNYRMKNGILDYIKRQYTFNSDGSYYFFSKAFDPLMEKIIFGKESGTYQVNGANVTLNPKKSVLEGWSKKDGTDKWGKKLNSQNISLEKTSYRFSKYYFSGIQVTALVMQADKATNRDGPFSKNTNFSNAWYYNPLSPNNLKIELPPGE